MKKLINTILLSIVIFTLFYLLGCFYDSSFVLEKNTKQWIITGTITFIVVIRFFRSLGEK